MRFERVPSEPTRVPLEPTHEREYLNYTRLEEPVVPAWERIAEICHLEAMLCGESVEETIGVRPGPTSRAKIAVTVRVPV